MKPFLDVDVHGMTRDEARAKIKSILELVDKFNLSDKSYSWVQPWDKS